MKHNVNLDNLEMKGAVDTLSITSSQTTDKTRSDTRYLNNIKPIDKDVIQYILNPHYAGFGEIKNLTQLNEAISYMLADMGINDFYINRVDFKLDSNKNNYDEYLKLNTLLTILMELAYKYKKKSGLFRSNNQLTGVNLTAAYRGTTYEIEYYNKAEQEPWSGIQSRLELRLKRQHGTDIGAILQRWKKLLLTLPKYYDFCQTLRNQRLFDDWQNGINTEYRNPNEFMRFNHKDIYTRNQLISLFMLMQVNNPIKSAENLLYNFGHIQFISLSDLIKYINLIIRQIDIFVVPVKSDPLDLSVLGLPAAV